MHHRSAREGFVAPRGERCNRAAARRPRGRCRRRDRKARRTTPTRPQQLAFRGRAFQPRSLRADRSAYYVNKTCPSTRRRRRGDRPTSPTAVDGSSGSRSLRGAAGYTVAPMLGKTVRHRFRSRNEARSRIEERRGPGTPARFQQTASRTQAVLWQVSTADASPVAYALYERVTVAGDSTNA